MVSNPLVQQPAMTGGLDVGSPITFPEEQEDPRVAADTNTGGGIWGFFKVKLIRCAPVSLWISSALSAFCVVCVCP